MGGETDSLRIVLLGANGQVGFELRKTLDSLGSVTALGRSDADLGNPNSLRGVVRQLRPNVLVNAAAYTEVDSAEAEPDLAMTINATAPKVIAEEAELLGACLVHYSTDFVFDGIQDHPYSENMEPNPLSAYGRSKLAGEREIANACRRHIILRTSWVYGSHGKNFLRTILRIAKGRSSLNVIEDQTGAPSSASLIAEKTALIVRAMNSVSASDDRWGIYHLTAGGKTSWFAYAKYIVEKAHEKGLELRLPVENILPILAAEYALPARRPANSVLATRKIRQTFGLTLPCWKTGVDQVLDDLVREK